MYFNDFYNNLVLKVVRYKNRISKGQFRKQIKKYNVLNMTDEFVIRQRELYPRLYDRALPAGKVDGHYFLQDIYMTKKILQTEVETHYDVGSRVEGLITHLLASGMIKRIILLDIRPLPISFPGLDFLQTDATNLNEIDDNSLQSLSSLHAVEHFGLGRYGDPIDPEGWRKALKSMQRKLAKGGYLYLSVPIGKEQKLCFNAHRVFVPKTIVETLNELDLVSFAYIHEMRIFEIDKNLIGEMESRLGDFDCGLFIFRK